VLDGAEVTLAAVPCDDITLAADNVLRCTAGSTDDAVRAVE